MERTELHRMSDETMNELIQQLMKEREHRRQTRLSEYRCELEQMWHAIIAKVKELDEMNINVSVNVEKEGGEGGELYFSLTDLLKEEGFMVTIHTDAVYKSKS